MVSRATGAGLGVLIDRLIGEPPESIHPVAAFGRLMQRVEDRVYRDARAAGVAHAGLGVVSGLAAGRLLGSTAIATWSATAGRGLGEAATAVGAALGADELDHARALLPSLVGRDPAGLDHKEIARAVIESVAENTVDAIVAPALWAAVGGAAGVAAHRAVNTMDAMVGHHSERYERYGWAAARLDDVAAWVPARATAALVALVRPDRAAAVWAAVRDDAPAYPSPNSGVAEAAFAAALALRLGGESRYGDRVEVRPTLGRGRTCEPADIERAVRLSRDVSLAVAGILIAFGAARGRRARR